MTRQHPFVFTFIIEWIGGLKTKKTTSIHARRVLDRGNAQDALMILISELLGRNVARTHVIMRI